jgi:hypothetical protein
MVDLESEFTDCLIRLFKMDRACPEGIGAAYGEVVDRRRFWEPSDRGKLLMVVGEYAGEDLVDLLAWRPSQPNRVYARTGIAAMAGENNLHTARFLREQILVHRTIEDYARSGFEGCCLFRNDFERLISLSNIDVDDLELGERISAAHRAPPPWLPKIRVRQP